MQNMLVCVSRRQINSRILPKNLAPLVDHLCTDAQKNNVSL